MNKFFILVLLFHIFSCEKEAIKKKTTPSPVQATPIVQIEKTTKPANPIYSNSENSKTIINIPKSSHFTVFWQTEKNRISIIN